MLSVLQKTTFRLFETKTNTVFFIYHHSYNNSQIKTGLNYENCHIVAK